MKKSILFVLISFMITLPSGADELKVIYREGVRLMKKNPAGAVEKFSEALLKSDRTWKYRSECALKRGQSYLALEKYPLAVADFFTVLSNDPKNFEGHKGIALALIETDRTEETLYHIDKANELNAKDPDVHYARGRLFLQQAYKAGNMLSGKLMNTAYDELTRAIELRSDFARAYFYRGMINTNYGNASEGRIDIEKSLSLDPNYSLAHFEIAKIQFTNEQFSACEESLRACIRAQNNFYPAWTMLIPINLKLDNVPKAREDLKKALQLYPRDGFLRQWNFRMKVIPEESLPPLPQRKKRRPKMSQSKPKKTPKAVYLDIDEEVPSGRPDETEPPRKKPSNESQKKIPEKPAAKPKSPPKPPEEDSDFPEQNWY